MSNFEVFISKDNNMKLLNEIIKILSKYELKPREVIEDILDIEILIGKNLHDKALIY